jgi:hypothetical protein
MVPNEMYWIQKFDALKPPASPGQAHGRIIELNMLIEFYMKFKQIEGFSYLLTGYNRFESAAKT